MDKKVRVRYAPSPSGYLHIGGARSALFNYLFAKRYGGDFVFRIEDTDIARNIEGAEYSQLHDLIWLNIIPDESIEKMNPKYAPYRQTEKIALYQEYAQKLIDMGYAYECFCNEEEIEASRLEQEKNGNMSYKYDRKCMNLTKEEKEKFRKEGRIPSIRLKVPTDQTIEFDDLVRGKVSFNSDDFGDFVIIKSNGIPTYNFAVVIDDHIMDITHVFRGEEHLSNTPKQIIIYNYFGWEIPSFGHMTIIISENGKKLSKRDHNIMQFMSQYKEKGYLPAAIDNFLLLLGWTPKEDKEIFSMEEAIAAFDPSRLSSSPSTFDQKKLDWMNGQYIKKMNDEEYALFINPFIACYFKDKKYNDEELLKISLMFKQEICCGSEIITLLDDIFLNYANLTEEETLFIKSNNSSAVLNAFKLRIDDCDLSKEQVNLMMKDIQKDLGIKGKDLYMPIRLVLTGKEHGIELYNILSILGKEEIKNRIKKYYE
ncbi:MAG: glutamate--tRNA ligase [Bacilli bacterium]